MQLLLNTYKPGAAPNQDNCSFFYSSCAFTLNMAGVPAYIQDSITTRYILSYGQMKSKLET